MSPCVGAAGCRLKKGELNLWHENVLVLTGNDLDFGTTENELLSAVLDGHAVIKAIGIVAGCFCALRRAALVAVGGGRSVEDAQRAQAICLRTMVAKPDGDG